VRIGVENDAKLAPIEVIETEWCHRPLSLSLSFSFKERKKKRRKEIIGFAAAKNECLFTASLEQ